MTSLVGEWLIYRNMAIVKDAGPAQLDECKKAFYAGAAVMVFLSRRIGESPDTPEQIMKDVTLLKNIEMEVHEFYREQKGKAGL